MNMAEGVDRVGQEMELGYGSTGLLVPAGKELFFTNLVVLQHGMTVFYFLCSWMKHVVGALQAPPLVVPWCYFPYGHGSGCQLDALRMWDSSHGTIKRT